MYSKSNVRTHDPASLWTGALLREWGVQEAIGGAVTRVVASPLFWPADPFRTLLQTLRRRERGADLSPALSPPLPPPPHTHTQGAGGGGTHGEDALQGGLRGGGHFDERRDCLDLRGHTVRMCAFSPLRVTGQPYLSMLVSSGSLRRAQDVLAEYHGLLGGALPPPPAVSGSSAQYIEALHISSCLSGGVSRHRPHRHEVVVEGSLGGDDLDAGLLLFIRRVLQEGAAAEAARGMLGARVFVSMRAADEARGRQGAGSEPDKTPFSFVPSEIKSGRRAVILSSMRAALIDGGSVWLDSHHLSAHTIPALGPGGAHRPQPSAGFVRCRRRYRFTFHDTRRGVGAVKCYYRNPYETLALCVFEGAQDSTLVRQNFVQHCKRKAASPAGGEAREEPSPSLMEDCVLTFVRDTAALLVSLLDRGELVLAAESAMLLAAHAAPSPAAPLAALRLSCLGTGSPGYLRVLRGAAESAGGVAGVLLQELRQVEALGLRSDRALWSDAATAKVGSIICRFYNSSQN
jgi:hypothetical protein